MKRRILIVGGAGFVGRHLIRELTKQSYHHKIVVADIASLGEEVANSDFIRWDVREVAPATLISGQYECIINLAAVHKSPGHPPHEYFETNILGARNVCSLAKATACNRIIFTSSIAVYGTGEDLKTEDSLPMPSTPYGISKIVAEFEHKLWQSESPGRSLLIVRPALIFGKGESGNFTRIVAALRKGIFVYPGRRDTIKSCCYVKDVCRFLVEHINETIPLQLFNFCYPEKITIEQICTAISEALGYRLPKICIPASIVNAGIYLLRAINIPIVSRLGLDSQRVAKLVNSTNISANRLIASGFKFKYGLVEAIRDWSSDCDSVELS